MNWRNSEAQWGYLAIGFHWLSVLAVFSLFALGLWMVELSYYDPWYKQGPFIHKSIGILLFLLTLLRLLWRYFNLTPLALTSHTEWEIKAAKFSHTMLYILLFSVLLSGYLISTADGRAVDVFNIFSVPATISGLNNQEDIAGEIHEILAFTLIGFACLHAFASIKHHLFDKDVTLKRMLGQGKTSLS